MTTTFDSRERGYENKYAHDQEVEFKMAARANHLIGLWAAGLLQLSGNAAEEYSQSIVEKGMHKQSQATIKEQLQKDFSAAGLDIDIKEIEKKIDAVLQDVKNQA